MSVVRQIGPWVVLSTFAAAFACGGAGAPSTPTNTIASATPTDTTPPSPPATTAPPAETTPPTPPAPPPTASAPPPTPPVPPVTIEEVQEPKGTPQHIKLTIADGRPKGLKSGAFESYWLWKDPGTTHWHLRTTTHSVEHRFQGFVMSEDGSLADAHMVRTEHKDHMRVDANKATFDFSTKGHEDGLDFDAPDDRCLRFHLLIDGKGHPDRVNVGKNDAHPPHYWFKICQK